MSLLLRIASVSLLLGGCAIEEATTTAVEQEAGSTCSPFICGGTGNSPEIDNKSMHDLYTGTGLTDYAYVENAGQFGISLPLRHEVTGYKYWLFVREGRVHAVSDKGPPLSVKNNTPTKADDLEHLPIVLKHPSAPNGAYELRFLEENREIPFKAKPNGKQHFTSSYRLAWDDWTGNVAGDRKRAWKNVCTDVSPLNDNDGVPEHHVVVFEADRIDADKIQFGVPEKGWWNIGCASHALAKLHLAGHTEAAQRITASQPDPMDRFQTTIEERQAWAKMIAGDYCGTGRPFTVAGQPLEWRDDKKWMAATATDLEARWTHEGATCVNKPRVHANPTANSANAYAGYNDVLEAMRAECPNGPPPPCSNNDAQDIGTGEHMFSANP